MSALAEFDEEATYLWVAETLLRKHQRPMRARELVTYGLEDGLFSDKDLSRTPQKSMQARLSMDILNRGERSRFVRTSRGKFFLRELLAGSNQTEEGLQEYVAERRIAPPAAENVLAVPRSLYDPILRFQGIGLLADTGGTNLLQSRRLDYIPRTLAETLDDYKQIVTYTIIQHKSQVLSFTRGNYSRAASFLRGARCIGFGGHVTDDDYNLFTYNDNGIRANAAREIYEELVTQNGRPDIDPSGIEVLGLLNDDSSEVGVRHLAVVLRYWVEDWEAWRKPQRGEASINQLRWIDTAADRINLADYEYWSQLLIRRFFPASLNTTPSHRILRSAAFRPPHLVTVTGPIGSGKSVATRAIVEAGGYQEVNTGRVVASLIGMPPVPDTPRPEFQRLAQEFITQPDGPERLATAIVAEAKRLGGDKFVIDGVRHAATLSALREKVPELPVALIYVQTPPDVAWEMYRFREASQEPPISFREFVALYNAPVERDIKYMIAEADAVLYNWIGMDQYDTAIRRLLEEIAIGTD